MRPQFIEIKKFRDIIEFTDPSEIKKLFNVHWFLKPESFSEYKEMLNYCDVNDIAVSIKHYRGLIEDKFNDGLRNGIAETRFFELFKNSFVEQTHSNYHALQHRIQQASQTGNAELNRDASNILQQWPYPRYYLDFGTISRNVPNRSYTSPHTTQLPCQWSCHIEHAPGQLKHEMFMDQSDDPSLEKFLQTLLDVLGNTGPIFVYSQNFEKNEIGSFTDLFPNYYNHQGFDTPFYSFEDRIIDLLPLTALSYYHPEMHGSWSLKTVLATIAPDMSDDRLKLNNDRDAQTIYRKILHPNIKDARKQELIQELFDYWTLKTLSMVRLTWFLQGCDIWTFLPSLTPGTQLPLVLSKAPEKPDPLLHRAEEALRQYCLKANTKMVISPKSYLQEFLEIGFSHASFLMNQLCVFGILSQHTVLNSGGNFSPAAAAGTVMSPVNTQKLFARFDPLYRRRERPETVWDFECGDGWFDLIWNLSKAIEIAAISEGIYPYDEGFAEAIEVKQKNGELHFYLAKDDGLYAELINEANLASKKICEVCSAPASLVMNAHHRLKTLCAEHTEEFLRSSPPVINPENSPGISG